MTLKDRIQEDMKSALRAHQSERLSAVRMLLAAVRQREIDERIVLDDAAIVSVVDKETAEIAVLQAYLPQRLSADEVAREVAALVAELGAAGPGDMGKVMGAAKARFAGKADMALVSAAVKAALLR
jgi:uncharacterized protein YqeY